MKAKNWFVTITAMLLIAAVGVNAEEAEKSAEKKAPVELKQQTMCPVMNVKLDSSAYTDIQGQRIYHCCPTCTRAIETDPEKYFEKAAIEGIMFENIQTTCPICNMKLNDKAIKFRFEGRQIHTCSESCQTAFEKDAPKYLALMNPPTKDADKEEAKADKKESTGHEGHSH